MTVKTALTQDRLKELLHYDPETGTFARLKSLTRTDLVGPIKGYSDSSNLGRVTIYVDGRNRYAHQLAWLYMTGEWPSLVDHKDGDAANNRWSNLRLATKSQNGMNAKLSRRNKSGLKGVHWHKQSRKWLASIRLEGRTQSIGLFPTKEDAHKAYCEKAKELFGEFARF